MSVKKKPSSSVAGRRRLASLKRRADAASLSGDPGSREERELRQLVAGLIARARELGYVVQLEVGRPAPARLGVSLSALYLKPLDGSDMFVCSCCGCAYDMRMRSRHLPNYLPLNWCKDCRAELREGHSQLRVAFRNASRRVGLLELTRLSELRVRRVIESWGPPYKRELKRLLAEERERLRASARLDESAGARGEEGQAT